jgi:hypothetical protein
MVPSEKTVSFSTVAVLLTHALVSWNFLITPSTSPSLVPM